MGMNRQGGAALLTLAKVVAGLCVCGAIALAVMGVSELRERRAGDDYYAELAQVLIHSMASDARETMEIGDESDGSFGASERAAQTGDAGGESTAMTRAGAPADGAFPRNQTDEADGNEAIAARPEDAIAHTGPATRPSSEMDFELLRQSCPDAVAWLRVENTVIDYPVCQGTDNEFYLHHLPDGTVNSAGALMLDVRCSEDFSDQISIIHGHHMRNGSMFGDLDEYKSEEYYNTHRAIRLYTPYGDWNIAIIAAYTLDGDSFGYPTGFNTDAEMQQFIEKAKAASAFDSAESVEWQDHLLILSTCAYSFESARFVLIGKMVGA